MMDYIILIKEIIKYEREGRKKMKTIYCSIYNVDTGKSQMGRMFEQEDTWGFDQLVAWVYRNCQNCSEIKIDAERTVIAIYDDRWESYTFDQKYLRRK